MIPGTGLRITSDLCPRWSVRCQTNRTTFRGGDERSGVMTRDFFVKEWTQAELDALFGKEMESGQNILLPIWHHISKDEVQQHSPVLAGLLALKHRCLHSRRDCRQPCRSRPHRGP